MAAAWHVGGCGGGTRRGGAPRRPERLGGRGAGWRGGGCCGAGLRFDSPALTLFNAWYTRFAGATVVPVLGQPFEVGGTDDSTTANVAARLLDGRRAALPLRADYLHGTPVRAAVTASLRAALADLAARYGTADPAAWLTPAVTIHWTPLGAGSVPDTPWMNRGTYNQIVSLVPGRIRAENVVPPGQSGDVRSPHFADQLRLYATWTYKPMRLTEDDLAGYVTGPQILPVPDHDQRLTRYRPDTAAVDWTR